VATFQEAVSVYRPPHKRQSVYVRQHSASSSSSSSSSSGTDAGQLGDSSAASESDAAVNAEVAAALQLFPDRCVIH
jgi:hypothetical protein